MRVAIVTRGDLFPTDHGAAVKIVRTAEHLSLASGEPCFVITDDPDHYHRFDGRSHSLRPYSPRQRAAMEWPPLPRLRRWAPRVAGWVGYPDEEHFLYQPLFDPGWWVRCLGLVRAEGISVLQAEFPGYALPAAVGAALAGPLLGQGVQSSLVQHNVEWDRLEEFGHPAGRLRRVEQGLLWAVDHVIAVSADDRRRMIAAGGPAERIRVIPHGVELAPYRAARPEGLRARYRIAQDAPLLVFHGTLHYWPNTEAVRFVVEQLLPRLLPRWPTLRVLVCGRSPPEHYAHPAVVFTGSVDDLPAHLCAADLAVCPLSAGGGTRMKLLEYMAAGLAIVSTTKGAEGLTAEPGVELEIADGPVAFAEAVSALLADPGRRSRMGQAARRHVERLDWSAVAAATLALYRGEWTGEDWAPAASAAPLAPAPPPVDAGLPRVRPGKDRTLLLLINRGCNLRCSFCDLWDNHEQMDVPGRLLPLLDEAVAIGTRVLVITGGEPFLHPDLFLAVREAKARGLAVNITTNGLLVDRRWEELRASGLDSLSVSLDGLEETHDRLRGQRGAWRRTVAALERCLAAGLACSVYFTVTHDNVAELIPVWERAVALGARFDFWPVNDAPELALRGPDDRAIFAAAIDRIGAHDPEVAGRRAYYLQGLDYHAGAAVPVRCLGLLDQYGVKYTGELLPCCVWGAEGIAVGNVFERPLRELWRSPAVEAARAKLLGEGCTAGCYNHSLYEFSQSTGLPFQVARPPAG